MRKLHWLVAVFLANSLCAAPAQLDLKWDQLAGVIAGSSVVVELKDGSSVRGVPVSVEPAVLKINVTSKSHRTYKKGLTSLPRTEIAGLRVADQKGHGRTGLLLGAAIGLGGGVGTMRASQNCRPALFLGETCDPIGSAALAGGLAIMVAAPVAGYIIGRSAGRQETRIALVPD